MNKKYVVDTNVLIENHKAIEILRNGQENDVFIPQIVIQELDKLKKNLDLAPRISQIVDELIKYADIVKIIKSPTKTNINDDQILEAILNSNIEDPVLVTNDKMLRFKAMKVNIQADEFKQSVPFESESELYTGFIENEEDFINNCFFIEDDILNRYMEHGIKSIPYENDVWKVKPRHVTQNAMFDLAMDGSIDLLSVQSPAGYGKTFCALAAALHLVFQMKKYKKIYIFKPNIEIGKELGFLPGDINEKMAPYFRPIVNLLLKLIELRPCNKIFLKDLEINTKKIELLPINFLRGDNLEDAVVIIDEIQNLSRAETRTCLSRMGENVKCMVLGDTNQIDNRYLNSCNNGLNWIVRKFKGSINYGHVTLTGEKSRGPIADLVRNRSL